MGKAKFPFLFGGTFIEGVSGSRFCRGLCSFPFLFGGTFIEGGLTLAPAAQPFRIFPFLFGGTFIEGLQ